MGWEICLMEILIPLSANGSHQEATCTFRDSTSVALDALPIPIWELLRAGDLCKPKVSHIFGFLYCTFVTVPARAASGETCTFPRFLVVSMSFWQNLYYLSDQQVSSLVCNHCCQSPIKWEKFPLPIHKEIPLKSNVLLKSFVYSDNTAFLKVYCTLGFTKTYFLWYLKQKQENMLFISMTYFVILVLFIWIFVILRNKEFSWASFFQDISF